MQNPYSTSMVHDIAHSSIQLKPHRLYLIAYLYSFLCTASTLSTTPKGRVYTATSSKLAGTHRGRITVKINVLGARISSKHRYHHIEAILTEVDLTTPTDLTSQCTHP